MIIYLRILIFPAKTRITWYLQYQNSFQSLSIIEYYDLCLVNSHQCNWDDSMCVTVKQSMYFIWNNLQWSAQRTSLFHSFSLCPSVKSMKYGVTWWLLIRFEGLDTVKFISIMSYDRYSLLVRSFTRKWVNYYLNDETKNENKNEFRRKDNRMNRSERRKKFNHWHFRRCLTHWKLKLTPFL